MRLKQGTKVVGWKVKRWSSDEGKARERHVRCICGFPSVFLGFMRFPQNRWSVAQFLSSFTVFGTQSICPFHTDGRKCTSTRAFRFLLPWCRVDDEPAKRRHRGGTVLLESREIIRSSVPQNPPEIQRIKSKWRPTVLSTNRSALTQEIGVQWVSRSRSCPDSFSPNGSWEAFFIPR